jgi:hypothetical protein
MSVWCSGRGGWPEACDLTRKNDEDGVGGWPVGSLLWKKFSFAVYFRFLSADSKNLSAGGWLKRPPALGLYAGGRTTASTETICASTRSLAGAPPASTNRLWPSDIRLYGESNWITIRHFRTGCHGWTTMRSPKKMTVTTLCAGIVFSLLVIRWLLILEIIFVLKALFAQHLCLFPHGHR